MSCSYFLPANGFLRLMLGLLFVIIKVGQNMGQAQARQLEA